MHLSRSYRTGPSLLFQRAAAGQTEERRVGELTIPGYLRLLRRELVPSLARYLAGLAAYASSYVDDYGFLLT
jgi:hypothetical protein